MEPRIQYAKTSDGVSIAYYAMGRGPPLLVAWGMPSNVQLEWRLPDARSAFERAAQQYTVIRYDARGCGLSEREVTDFSIDALTRDLEAVIHRLGMGPIALIARMELTPMAIAFAARHPGLLSRLVLLFGFARGADFWTEQLEGLVQVAERDWEFTTRGVGSAATGWSRPDVALGIATLLRTSITPKTFVSFMHQLRQWDVTNLLSSLSVPTLVLHGEHRYYRLDLARQLAAAIPDARLAVMEEGRNEFEAAARATQQFLAGRETESIVPSGTAIILFADIVDSTALTERMGDAAFRERARELDGALRAAIRDNGGTPIEGKLLGDGVLAVFTSARQAIEAGLRCAAAGSHGGLPLHLGVHAGDVIREENNVYGGAVNIAARISGLSAPGEVLVSDTVRGLARTSAGVRFEDRGEQALKGVSELVRVWVVREGEAS